MTPNSANGAGRAQPAARSSRPPPGRVVPAIPLALSKPKAAKPPPKIEPSTKVVEEQAKGEQGAKANGVNGVQNKSVEPSEKKLGSPSTQATPVQEQAKENGIETPRSHGSANMSISAGAMPDIASTGVLGQPAASINGQTDSSSTATTATSSGSRKQVDRLDMRQVRSELPPAFVPSGTPLSASSQFRPPPSGPHAHPSHPSASSIVFGGHDSSTSSPAPPVSAGSAYSVPPQQHPAFAQTQFAEPPSQRIYHPAYAQGQVRPEHAPGPPPPAHTYYNSNGQLPPRYPAAPPRDNHVNGYAVNGHGLTSRQGSRHSSAAHDGFRSDVDLQSPIGVDQAAENVPPGFRDARMPFHAHHHQNSSMHSRGNPPYLMEMENAESLRAHVLSQFRNPDLSDCQLQIIEESGPGRQYMDAHKLVLSRSPTLLNLIGSNEHPAAAAQRTQIQVVLKGQHLRVDAFLNAVAFLYGGSLPSAPMTSISLEDRMQFAFQHIAVGMWLRVAAVADRGMTIALETLSWETIPAVLAFGLQGGLGATWPIDDSNEEKTSTCSSDDAFIKPEVGGVPFYDPYASTILHRTVDYIVHNCPPEFYLDPAAPQLEHTQRLPVAPTGHESKSSRSDPRLSKIRFGEAPASDHQRPDSITTHISSILLSLPFPVLKFLLEHPVLPARIGPETVASITRQVINERETRRQKAHKAHATIPGISTAEGYLIQNLFWEEYVEPSYHRRAGCRLARKRQGTVTPPSSGNESERVK